MAASRWLAARVWASTTSTSQLPRRCTPQYVAPAPWQHAAMLHALLTVHQRTSAACRGSWGKYTAHSSWWLLQFGCLVVNAPTANTIAAAEHGIALLCALTRNVAQADASVKQVGRTVVVQSDT